jgi:hypothetical protein
LQNPVGLIDKFCAPRGCEPGKRLLADFERVLEERDGNAERLTMERIPALTRG